MTASPQSVRQAALAWFVRVSSGDVDATTHAACAAWRTADPAHEREFQRLAGLWKDLDAADLPPPATPVSRPRPAVLLSRRAVLAGACGAAALAVVPAGLSRVREERLATAVGERRSATLPDGSLADMDAGTVLVLTFGGGRRRVEVREGRAQFDVAPTAEPGIPFEVICAGGTATSAGARFVIHRRPESVVLAVQEGSATLRAPHGSGGSLLVAAGRRVCYGPGGVISEQAAGAMDTAWKRGRLIFRDQPLEAVVADLNRYHRGRIVIWGAVGSLRVEGSVEVSEPEAALAALVATLPVRALHLSPYLVVLHAA